MNETQKAVSAAQTPQQALLQIAVSLDRLHDKLTSLVELDATPLGDPWGPWADGYGPPQDGVHPEPETTTLKVTKDEAGETAIVLPLPSPESDTFADRYEFARDVLQLDAMPAGDYADYGPVWYHAHHRNDVVQHGRHVHVQMIQDAETYDPQGAAEMARDILKVKAEGMDGGVMVAEGRVG
jgi:hypothetical protein